MKVSINENACIGCGACEAVCDTVFEVDSVAHVKVEEVDDGVKEDVQNAFENCPTNAIIVEERDLQP